MRRPNRNVVSVLVGLALWIGLSEPGLKYARTAYDHVASLGISLGVLELVHGEETMDSDAADPIVKAGKEDDDELEDEQRQLMRTIAEHCLPKLVCELYSKEFGNSLTDGEVTLMSLIGVTTLSPSGPSKYHFAAHMGQLIRGIEGKGCHEFFPSCPFSGEDVRQIARKINMK